MRWWLFGAFCLAAGCKSSGPMSKIDAEKAALVKGDAASISAATANFQACAEQPYVANKSVFQDTCLNDIANGFGSTMGFVVTPPDNAAAATAALVLLRDSRGDAFTFLDTWLSDIRITKGAGHDALRLAVARKMAEAAPLIGKLIDTDDASRAAMKAVVGAVPGACNTYYLVGNGAALEKMPAPLTPDHSACVQKDLKRMDAPGPMYGRGIPRALEGSLAVWREAAAALRAGMEVSAPDTKAVLEEKLVTIDAATRASKTKQSDQHDAIMDALRGMQDHADAGALAAPPSARPAAPLKPPVRPGPSPSPLENAR